MISQAIIQAWVGCIASYNQGDLFGRWINFDQPLDEVWAEVNAMLKESPVQCAEEYQIMDSEGFFGSIGEHTSIEEAHRIAKLIVEHGEGYARYADNVGLEYAEEAAFEDAYQGHWDSQMAFAEHLVDECGMLQDAPDLLSRYFDYDAFARDLFMSDYYSLECSDGGVFVFANE